MHGAYPVVVMTWVYLCFTNVWLLSLLPPSLLTLLQFEALNKCMEKNKDMFDDLLGEMKEEEERAKQQQEASSSSNAEAAAAAATAGGATTHSAAEQPPQSHTTHGAAAAGTSHADSAAQPATTSSGHSQGPGVPATV